jgi:hypothetical protein
MKKLFLLFVCLPPIFLRAQPKDTTALALYHALQAANPKSPSFNPQRAFALYTQYAQAGNAQAMNGLGMLYNSGIGTAVDEQSAFYWFEKAAKGGYARAWYNLGLLYKNGMGREQDFAKAIECYTRGAAANDVMSFYAMGYMQYKGFGCPQSYANAIQSFHKALIEPNAMYMLGLCFRNGYGVAVDLDSARFWLAKAADRGLQYAKEELASSTPENKNIHVIPDLERLTAGTNTPDPGSGYYTVKYQMSREDIPGEYSGYTIKFDWSGQFIIGESALKLTLSRQDNLLSGKWSEEAGPSTNITAMITDSALVFNNTSVTNTDHYNQTSANQLEFKNASLQLIRNNGMVYLQGNLQLFSETHNEPEKPEFVLLVRTASLPDSIDNKSDLTADSAQFTAYPNPFTDRIQFQYNLRQACTVQLMVTALGSGVILYQGTPQYQEAGPHSDAINVNGAGGAYVVTLWHGNHLQSTILIKK